MPQPTKGPRLGGSPDHQKLLLANLATSLFTHGRIHTTRAKAERLRPYAPGASAPGSGAGGLLSVSSFREVIGPLASGVGGRLARIAGVDEALTTRLRRIHSDVDATSFRVRQLGWTAAGTGFGVVFAVVAGVPGSRIRGCG